MFYLLLLSADAPAWWIRSTYTIDPVSFLEAISAALFLRVALIEVIATDHSLGLSTMGN